MYYQNKDMYYPRFTKVIINNFMSKDQSIPRRNKVDWHMAKDDPILTTMRFIPKHEIVQKYGAILPDTLTNQAMKESDAYKTYYYLATGRVIPKPKYVRRSTWEKTEQSDEDDDDEISMSKDDDDNADNKDDDGQDGDNEQTESDNDGDDFVHPKFSTHNEEERQDEEDKEEEGSDLRVQTPSHFESTDDEAYDEVTQGDNVKGEEPDEEKTNENEEVNEMYMDVNVNLERRDTKMTDAPRTNQSSSVSSGFISNMLNPNPDTGIDSILNLNTKSTSLVDVPITTNAEMPPSSVTTLPLPPIPLIQPLRLLKIQQTNLFAEVVSLILGIVDKYLSNQMNKDVKSAVQLQSDRLRDEAQAENEDFINKPDENMRKIIKEQLVNEQLESEVLTRSYNEAKTSHVVAANLSKLELKKILIDKKENNKSIDRSVQQKNLYKALVDAYETDKDEDDEPSAGSNRGSKRRRAGKEPESTSESKEKTSKSTGKSKEGSKSHQKSTSKSAQAEEPIHTTTQLPDWFQKPTKPPTPNRDWNKTFPTVHGPIQPWISTLARNKDPRDSFNELTDTPLEFSAFVFTPELLSGLTFELMKGSCMSQVELEYFLKEVCKATTDQLDWNNPEGQQYPHDLRKPLPLIPNLRGRRVIPFDHFINNDLTYLSGGVLIRTYATSVTKTKAADYEHIKWIEDLVQTPCGVKEYARDVYSRHRINAVTKLTIIEWHNYKHLDWITVRRDDDKLYTFKESNYKRLRLQDIKEMLLLLVQGKLKNLTIEERLALGVSLRMFTISIVIQRHVEDLQLGVESCQKKINLIRPDTYRSDLKRKLAYTAYSNPRGFIYHNKDKKNRLMRIHELHKFSDGTLNDVRSALHDILKRIRIEYLPQTVWRNVNRERAGAMIQAINRQLMNRRIMRSLEKFVGGRPFNTTAGNPVKEIILKLNLPDHRSILTDSKEYIKMDMEVDPYGFEGYLKMEVKVPDSNCLEDS
ncbi:hypothetical protein Tco_0067136 [Tanacetum coccineum]